MYVGSITEAMLLILFVVVGVHSIPIQLATSISYEPNILLKMKQNLGQNCNFPPLDVLSNPTSVPYITSCDRPAPEKPNDYFDEGLYLCMALYDAGLRICDVLPAGELNDKLPQNATSFRTLFDSFSKKDDFSNTLFCNNLKNILTNTSFGQTQDWVSTLNSKLENANKCESICFNDDNEINPICKILFWANTLLKAITKTHKTGTTSNMNEDILKSQGREIHNEDTPGVNVNSQQKPKPQFPITANLPQIQTDSAKNDLPHDAPHTLISSATGEASPALIISSTAAPSHNLMHAVAADSKIAPLSEDTDQLIGDEEYPPVSGETEREQDMDIKSQDQTITGANQPSVEVKHGTVVLESVKPNVNNNGGVNVNPDSQTSSGTEGKSNKDSMKPVESDLKPNDAYIVGQQENYEAHQKIVDTTSSESPPSLSTTSRNLPLEPSSSVGKSKGSVMENEGKATAAGNNGQDDAGNEPGTILDNPTIDADGEVADMPPQQEGNYDGDVTQTEEQHSVKYVMETGKLPVAAGGDTESYVEDKFVDAEDSHFFAYFMAIIVLCIVGYLVFHNKQKILALAVEGRSRKNSRRRPNTSGYRKLDSNLEEAVTSPCSTSITHVIY